MRFRIFWARGACSVHTSLENTGSTGSPEAKVLLWCNGSTKNADVAKNSYSLLSVTNVDGRDAYSWPDLGEDPPLRNGVRDPVCGKYENRSR